MKQFELKFIETDSDIDFLLEVHNDPVVLHNITNPTPTERSHHLKWICDILQKQEQTKEMRLIFCVDGKNAGVAKIYSIDKINGNCVLGADLHKDFRGQGLAVEMWKLMLQVCFGDYGLCLNRVSLTTAEYNKPAIATYKKLNFKEEGRFIKSLFRDGKYYDQILFYMLKSDWEWIR